MNEQEVATKPEPKWSPRERLNKNEVEWMIQDGSNNYGMEKTMLMNRRMMTMLMTRKMMRMLQK